jgi:hypothetical protein
MFFNTATRFPEGTVLSLRFRLALTGAEIRTRCEVRYCWPGVGVGVEFIGISLKAVRKIEREVQLGKRPPPQKNSQSRITRLLLRSGIGSSLPDPAI